MGVFHMNGEWDDMTLNKDPTSMSSQGGSENSWKVTSDENPMVFFGGYRIFTFVSQAKQSENADSPCNGGVSEHGLPGLL